ncbi:MAG: DHA2 family efflux MFS transporter permease subunit [Dehalococcoidia bacterium]|jgi:DHA2 family multidrug resistance protein
MPQTTEWKILLAAIAGTFMVILDQTIMNIALPHIMAVFNVPTDHAQLVISAYLMATAITTPAAAFLCNRFGTKRVFIFSQASFLLGSILCGISWNADSLIIFRILQGLAGGLLTPTAMTLLFLNVPPQQRGTAMAIFGIPMMLGPAIGPTLGGYLVTDWSWRMCFYVNVPVVLVAILLGFTWIRETPTMPAGFDFKGFALAATGFSSVLYALSYAPTWGWDDVRIMGLLVLGTLSLIVWIVMELRSAQPMLDLRIFKNRGFSMATGLNFVTTIGLYSITFLLPLFLQNVRGLTALETGILMLPAVFGAIVTMPLAGRLYDRIGPKIPVVAGLIVVGAATYWMRTVDVTTPDNLLRLMLFVRSMGIGLAMMPVMTYALASVEQKMTAQASSIMNVSRTVFASLGIAIFATILTNLQKTNLALISQTLTPSSSETMHFISMVQVILMQAGQTLEAARQTAVYLLYLLASARAAVSAFQTEYIIAAAIISIGVIPAFFLPFGRQQGTQAATPMD